MTDYAAEQAMEIDALEAILMDDLQVYEGTLPDGWNAVGPTYKVTIDPDDDSSVAEHDQQRMELLWAHTANYPDEPPCYKLRSVQGLSDAELSKGMAVMQEVVTSNLGMAMVYALVSGAKDWLQSKSGHSDSPEMDPLLKRKKEDEEDEKRRAELRAHGVMVTVETFMAWKAAFDAEIAAEKQRLLEAGKVDERSQRLTGKAYFASQVAVVDEMDEDELEDGEPSDDDEVPAAPTGGAEDDEEEEEEFLDYEDDDDEGLLEEYEQLTVVKK